jgi:8-oxo-dGTP pyrophosphatase MutT (NUDIX family)
MSGWKQRVEPYARPAIRAWARLRRGMTLGVRGVVTDAQGRVLLIEHTYTPGWYLPGGGVDRGETPEQAVARELVEEAGVRPTQRPRLVSVHDNSRVFPSDYVLLYRIDGWRPVEATSRGEIAEVRFFARDDLPEGLSRGTRRRLDEVFGGLASDPYW